METTLSQKVVNLPKPTQFDDELEYEEPTLKGLETKLDCSLGLDTLLDAFSDKVMLSHIRKEANWLFEKHKNLFNFGWNQNISFGDIVSIDDTDFYINSMKVEERDEIFYGQLINDIGAFLSELDGWAYTRLGEEVTVYIGREVGEIYQKEGFSTYGLVDEEIDESGDSDEDHVHYTHYSRKAYNYIDTKDLKPEDFMKVNWL